MRLFKGKHFDICLTSSKRYYYIEGLSWSCFCCLNFTILRSNLIFLHDFVCNSPTKVSVPKSVELKPLLALDMSLNVSSSFFVEDASFSFRLSFATRSRDCSKCFRWMTFSPSRLLVRCKLTSMSESSRSSWKENEKSLGRV